MQSSTMEIAIRRAKMEMAVNSQYWALGRDALVALVKRRIGSVGIEELERIDLICVLLHQDKKETISRASDRTARAAAVNAAIAHNSTAAIPIFKISAELRNRIYDLAVLSEEPVFNTASHSLATCPEHPAASGNHMPISTIGCHSLRVHLEPALLRTCKLFRAEAYQLYYGQQCFSYSSSRLDQPAAGFYADSRDVGEWLVRFGERLPLLRNVQIEQRIRVETGVARVYVRIRGVEAEVTIGGHTRWEQDPQVKDSAVRSAEAVVEEVEAAMPWVSFATPW